MATLTFETEPNGTSFTHQGEYGVEVYEKAKDYYRNETGLSDETCTDMQSLKSAVAECWKGKTFIAISSD